MDTDDQYVAAGTDSVNYRYLASGNNAGFGFVTVGGGTDPGARVGGSFGGNSYGVYAYAGPGFEKRGEISWGPKKNPSTWAAGVLGTSREFTGVAGTSGSVTQPGVYGQSGEVDGLPGAITAGVFGASDFNPGIKGWSENSNGVEGEAITRAGVSGFSKREQGVLGRTGSFPFGANIGDPNRSGSSDVRSTVAGVFGTALDAFGVAGSSGNSSGVIGQSGPPPVFDPPINYTAGVLGASRDATGVIAVSQNGFGIIASAKRRAAVSATSQDAAGVSAVSNKSAAVLAITAPEGPIAPAPYSTSIAAIRASSRDNFGVIATSETTHAIMGYSKKGTGVIGWSDNPASFAGFFTGNVFVTAALTATTKNAVVPFPDGSKRLLHCMESPEHWFEDFGSARLTRGRATVRLDPEFAQVVKLDDYRVFLTPEGDCQGLYVGNKTGKSFEVRELQGGASSVVFSYRIVGKRKDIKNHKRFEKIDMDPPAPSRPRGRIEPPSLKALLRSLGQQARKIGKRARRGRARKRARR